MPTVETKRSSPVLSIAVVAVLLVLGIFGIHALTRETVEVRVSPVTRENLISSISTNGKVEPIQEFQAHAPSPGVVRHVFVEVGQKVRAGDPLLKLDDTEVVSRIATASANLRTAQANASDLKQGGTQEERNSISGDLSRARLQQQQAAKDLATLQALRSKGAASAAEIAAAQQRLETAEGALQGAQLRQSQRFSENDRSKSSAQIAEARQALSAALLDSEKYNVRAPFAGTVYAIPVSAYDFVPAGEDLLDLADLDRIRVRAYFDEPEIGQLAPGQAVKIVWDAKPHQTWHGHIEVAPTTVITYGTRNVGECIITVDDAHGDLLPNTNVTVTVTTSQRFNALSIPREALHTESNSNFVYRVIGHRLVRTPVQVGVVNLTRVEIAAGLTDKDTVALTATSNRDLTNGMQVKSVE
ncbi:MAG: efflux RND transporter periplasmic adaptor subunit [Acidobacteriaceae bacterium]